MTDSVIFETVLEICLRLKGCFEAGTRREIKHRNSLLVLKTNIINVEKQPTFNPLNAGEVNRQREK